MTKPVAIPLSADELFAKMRGPNGHNQKNRKAPPNPILERHTPHQWLDEYIEHSKSLSPRAFELLHEACGIWALSAVAAGRVELPFGGAMRHTALMITVIAPSSRWSKSHTVKVATRLMKDAGLDWRGLPTKSTPQGIIEEMADNKRVAAILKKLAMANTSEEEEQKLNLELEQLRVELGSIFANEGQRFWHVSEFGTKIIEAMRPTSPMAAFSDFFRDINEKDEYVYKTRGHGREVIHDPYLAVIGDTTPADLAKYTRPRSPLWSNGFFPRFLIVTMTDQELKKRQAEEREGVPKARVAYDYVQVDSPENLTSTLLGIEEELGVRDDYDETLLKQRMLYSEEVWDAIYRYENHIDKHRIPSEDLDGTYTRLAVEQCVAVAMLLALADNSLEVQMPHVMRAQEFCERVRLSTEAFYRRATDNTVDDRAVKQNLLEEKILKIIQSFHTRKQEWPSQSDIRRRTGGSTATRLPHTLITEVLQSLKMANIISDIKVEGKRAPRWAIKED